MKAQRSLYIAVAGVLLMCAHPQVSAKESLRGNLVNSPSDERGLNAFSMELGGRGLYWGVTYDRMVSEEVALGVGYSSWGAKNEKENLKARFQIIPIYMNYYFFEGSHRAFLTGGLDLISGTVEDLDKGGAQADDSRFGRVSGSGAIPLLGGGYEYRSTGGFLFRASLYEFITGSKALTWAGLSVGLAI